MRGRAAGTGGQWLAVLLGAGVAMAAVAGTGLQIDATFEPGASLQEQVLHVEADFGPAAIAACRLLCDVSRYAGFHPWILESRVEETDEEGLQVVYFLLDLPWPVGRQWSRLRVGRFGDSMVGWEQIDGSFRKNRGSVTLRPEQGAGHMSYWAELDLGMPAALARPFQERFARQFLEAVYEAARRSPPAGAPAP
jgi:hypothetical protein